MKIFTFFIPLIIIAPLAALPASCSPGKDGGVWRSSDQAATWEQKVVISQKQSLAAANILNIAIDPLSDNILYLGTEGDGLFKSIDGGESWYALSAKDTEFKNNASIYRLSIDQRNTNLIYAAVFQDDFGRVFKSQDAGKNWLEIYLSSRSGYAVLTVEADLREGATIYIGTAEGGLLKSFDGGASWRALKWFDGGVFDVKIDTNNSQILYVGVKDRGIFKSVDGGNNWQELNSAKSFWETGSLDSLVMDKKNTTTLYAASKTGLLRTVDGGQAWQRVNIITPPESVAISAIAIDPNMSYILYYGAGNVIYKSQDGGATWSVRAIDTDKDISNIVVNYRNSNILFAGMNKNGRGSFLNF